MFVGPLCSEMKKQDDHIIRFEGITKINSNEEKFWIGERMIDFELSNRNTSDLEIKFQGRGVLIDLDDE